MDHMDKYMNEDNNDDKDNKENQTTESNLNTTQTRDTHTTTTNNNTTIKTINLTIPYVQQPFLIGTICWILGMCGGWILTGLYYLGCMIWPVFYFCGMILGMILTVVVVGLLILVPLGAMTKPDDASILRFVAKIKQLHKQNEELGWRNDLINPQLCANVSNCDMDPIPVDWGFFKIAQIMNKNQFNRTKIYIIGVFRGWYLVGR